METPIIIAVVAAVLGSNGLWMLIQSRLARKDAKEDKTDKVIEAIKELRQQALGHYVFQRRRIVTMKLTDLQV